MGLEQSVIGIGNDIVIANKNGKFGEERRSTAGR